MSILKFGADISSDAYPLRPPSPAAPHILIIGGGVIGLTTAWVLLDKGYKVTIISREWASFIPNHQRLTSQIAGALWEYPPAVCGHHTDVISLVNSKRWCMIAYHIWSAIAAVPSVSAASGVRIKPATFFFTHPIASDPALLQKTREIATSGVSGFSHTPDLIYNHPIDSKSGIRDAYQLIAPVIDTDTCLAWLTSLVHSKGATLLTGTIANTDLLTQESHLRHRFKSNAIVNASGLGALTLANDPTCYPIRGALLRFQNGGRPDAPKIGSAMAIPATANDKNNSTSSSSHSSNEIIFIVPRNDNILLVGGFTEPHEWDLDLTINSPAIQRMRARCEAFVPALKHLSLDEEYPLAQGLRPFRAGNVRVERELRMSEGKPSRIVHSYGHGGAGWSLSFGCAVDTVRLVEEALNDVVPVAMAEFHGSNMCAKL